MPVDVGPHRPLLPVTFMRFGLLAVIGLLTLIVIIISIWAPGWLWLLVIFVPLLAVGAFDRNQTRHSLRRNFPLLARFRWLFEDLGPFMRQYIVEDDLSGRPYSRMDRALIYARAKGDEDAHPFGTELDVDAIEYQLMSHSIKPVDKATEPFRVDVGGPQCDKPYSASILNISAMSFGALGGNAIQAMNLGAKLGGFYHDTGEGSISPYHRKHGGDLVWEVGSGYFGCRNKDGTFDQALFAEQAVDDQVRMVEIKLSQGAKPGHGGVLPGAKVTPEIAATRHVPEGQDCISPAYHTAFSTPRELVEFAAKMREWSGGKPAGIKLCVGHAHEVFAIMKAMLDSEILLDFIVVDGAEGGTGAAPLEFSDRLGMPLREGLILVRNALVGCGLAGKVKLAASGKVVSGFSLAANAAIGADWSNAARAFMFSVGCVQSLKCHTGRCPTGVTTQDPTLQRGLVIEDKAERVRRFHDNTLGTLTEMVAAAGLNHPNELQPHHLYHRVTSVELRSIDRLFPFLGENELIDDPDSTPYATWWRAASPDSFAAQTDVTADRLAVYNEALAKGQRL
ncbi:MAG: glutamate synthase-related protein [Pseudomonadota bacterium]